MRLYKIFSLAAAVVFAAVGLLFLFFPAAVLVFFNSLSGYCGLPAAPLESSGFYLILAAAYMYLVTLLAILMFLNPEQSIYPFLLGQGKLASSLISVFLFFTHQYYLIYLANFLVDGLIGIAALLLMRWRKQRIDNDAEKNNEVLRS